MIMSADHHKVLKESSNVLMSESLKGTVRTEQIPELVISQAGINIFTASKVYSFQKNLTGIEITCSISGIASTLDVLHALVPEDVLSLSYCGTMFENYECTEWGITNNDLGLPGENKLELIFKLYDNTTRKEILTD